MARPSWSYRNDAWWAQVAALLAGAVGIVGILGASGADAPAVVAAATVVTIAGYEAKARWPRIPGAALAVWTAGPAIAVNLTVWSEGVFFLVVVSVSFVVLTEPDRRIRFAVGAAGLLAPPAVAAVTHQRFGWPFWMMGISFGWLSGEQMRRFRRLVDELEATRERLAAQAVHVERRRIAADLHDLVGHSLTVVLLYLTGARRQLADDPTGAADALREAEEIGRASLVEIRRNVAALRQSGDAGLTPTPGACDLVELVERFAAAGSEVHLEVTGDASAVEAIVGAVAYRVVQESLSNAARHAPDAPVQVTVAIASDVVDIVVVDRGPSPSSSGRTGVGLIGMRERVEAVGGTLRAGPEGAGWAVRARVPRPALVEPRP